MEKIFTNGKINIGLNVLGKRQDGFHELSMIMAPIDICDEMTVTPNESGQLSIQTNIKEVPTDERNILYKIYKAFYGYTKIKEKGFQINLIKKIPLEAGLGGGSSNGAFFLKYLNEFENTKLTNNKLCEIGSNVGSDIPFFLFNTTSHVSGTGEKIKILENNLECDIILVKPNFGISTKLVYTNFKKEKTYGISKIEEIKKGLKENDLDSVIKGTHNQLQDIALDVSEDLVKFEDKLKIYTKDYFMTGSGSCYYIFIDKRESSLIYDKLKEGLADCFICKTGFLKQTKRKEGVSSENYRCEGTKI